MCYFVQIQKELGLELFVRHSEHVSIFDATQIEFNIKEYWGHTIFHSQQKSNIFRICQCPSTPRCLEETSSGTSAAEKSRVTWQGRAAAATELGVPLNVPLSLSIWDHMFQMCVCGSGRVPCFLNLTCHKLFCSQRALENLRPGRKRHTSTGTSTGTFASAGGLRYTAQHWRIKAKIVYKPVVFVRKMQQALSK